MTPVRRLRNIGPTSAGMLAEVGIETIEDLQEIGAIEAYRRLKFTFENRVSLNFLWALEAGLQGIDWRHLTDADKDRLKAGIQDL